MVRKNGTGSDKGFNKKELEEIFDLKKNVKHVDTVFKRLGLS